MGHHTLDSTLVSVRMAITLVVFSRNLSATSSWAACSQRSSPYPGRCPPCRCDQRRQISVRGTHQSLALLGIVPLRHRICGLNRSPLEPVDQPPRVRADATEFGQSAERYSTHGCLADNPNTSGNCCRRASSWISNWPTESSHLHSNSTVSPVFRVTRTSGVAPRPPLQSRAVTTANPL